MFEILRTIFSYGNFEPHGVHFIPDHLVLLWTLVAGNALIALSYTLIPLALLYIVRKRKDIIFTPIFFLFAGFIVLCGLTHVVHILTYWYPMYYLQSIVYAMTGIISIFTFFALVYIIPLALKLKTPKELEIINKKLADEVEAHKKAEDELKQKNLEVGKINQEILKSNEELSRLNKIMVDREVKMGELKKENEELRGKIAK